MLPIWQTLSKIRWDNRLNPADFTIHYLDRKKPDLVPVPFEEMILYPDDHFAFGVKDDDGRLSMIPYHRIRKITQNEETFWERP